MTQKLLILAVLILAVIGCGAGNAAEQDGEVKAKTITAQNDDFEKAEARKMNGVVSQPAVDTGELEAAPAWAMPDLDGAVLSSTDLAGKVVLVDFWATWCGPCRKGIPHLKDLYAEYQDKGVEVIGVSLDQKGPAVVRPFTEQYKINYPIVMGNQKVVTDFGGVRGIPTAFIISQDGKIYKKYVGLRPKATYEADIKSLLGLTS